MDRAYLAYYTMQFALWISVKGYVTRRDTDEQTANNSVALVREWTIPTERLPLVGEISANFLRMEGCRVVSSADPPMAVIPIF
jgi:hypothetical protein